MAAGHFVTGAVGYIVMKVVGLGLVAVIFDLTCEMKLTGCVVGYEKNSTRFMSSRGGSSRPIALRRRP